MLSSCNNWQIYCNLTKNQCRLAGESKREGSPLIPMVGRKSQLTHMSYQSQQVCGGLLYNLLTLVDLTLYFVSIHRTPSICWFCSFFATLGTLPWTASSSNSLHLPNICLLIQWAPLIFAQYRMLSSYLKIPKVFWCTDRSAPLISYWFRP